MNTEQLEQCLDHLEDAAFGYVGGAPNGVVEAARRSAEKLRTLLAGKVLVPVGAWFELNEQTKEILGRPNFACAGIASSLRAGGQPIPRKAEEEQVAVIYWMLSMYQKHGADWKKEAEKELAMLTASQEPKQ